MVEIWWVLALGGFAALVKYAQRFAGDKESRPQWEWSVAVIQSGTGSFVALLTVWLIETKVEARYVNFAIAIAGYGGATTLDFFQQILRDAISRAAQKSQDAPPKN